jgi:preprotein translocase subunit SecB
MTDTPTPASPNGLGAPEAGAPEAGVPDEAMQPGIRILAQYIRDLSFENPHAPESLRGGAGPPQIDLGVELNAKGRDADVFEVELKLTAAAKREGDAVFQVELVYAGLFQIVGVNSQEMEQVLMIECPRFLFPFARRLIADLSAEGGFPPLMLEPMDFAAIYLARKAQADAPAAGNA